MISRIILFGVLIFFCQSINAQEITFKSWNDSIYGVLDTFPTNAVADDFGPRDLGDDWHGGVDFYVAQGDGDLGSMPLAIENGTFPNDNHIIRNNQAYINTIISLKMKHNEQEHHKISINHSYFTKIHIRSAIYEIIIKC